MAKRDETEELIEPIIAGRTLYIFTPQKREVKIRIGKPRRIPNSFSVGCPFQISGIGDDKINPGVGSDSVQAIKMTLTLIGLKLWEYNRDHEDKIRWKDPNDPDLGFPLPDNIKPN